METNDRLMALKYIDVKVGEYFFAVHSVTEKRPQWTGNITHTTKLVLETALNAHRHGGVTSNQLKAVEGAIAEIDDILNGRK